MKNIPIRWDDEYGKDTIAIDIGILNAWGDNGFDFFKEYCETIAPIKKDEHGRFINPYQISFKYLRSCPEDIVANMEQLEFRNIIFQRPILFLEELLKKCSVRFTNCKFLDLNIAGVNDVAEHKLIFLDSVIDKIRIASQIKEVSFVRCSVKQLNIESSVFNSFWIDNTLVKKGSISDTEIKEDLTLFNCSVNNTIFSDCKINFIGPPPYKLEIISKLENVSFINSKIGDKADFSKMILTNCIFRQTEFCGKVNFNKALFRQKCSFSHTSFTRASFYEAIFKCSPEFNNIILEPTSHIYFGYICNNKKTPVKKVSIVNSVINGRIDFNHDNIKMLDLKDSITIGILNRIQTNPNPANWQTAVILKNEELKKNNVIEALRYKAIEKDLYQQELRATSKKTRQTKGEIAALWLSGATNNHGQDWIKATIVTIFCFWIIPFTIFYLQRILWDTTPYIVLSSNYLADLFEYFIPYNYDTLISYLRNCDIGTWAKIIASIFYMVGKILVPFGVFEIVQAFRKFNGKA